MLIIVHSVFGLLRNAISLLFTLVQINKSNHVPWSWQWIKMLFSPILNRGNAISISSIFFVAVSQSNCFCPNRWQWQFGTVAVFLTWISFILFLSDLSSIGVNIRILLKIIYRFLTVSIIAILLILAFGFAFYMAFYEPKLPVSS